MSSGLPSPRAPRRAFSHGADRVHRSGRWGALNFAGSTSHAREESRRDPALHPALQFIKGYIVLALVGLLTFSLLLTTVGFVASYASRRQVDAFASDGRTVIGIITDKHIQTGTRSGASSIGGQATDRNQTYWFDVRFQTQGGEYHAGRGGVPESLYDMSGVGQPVKVTYLGSDPDQFYLADNAPTDPSAPIFSTIFGWGVIASLLVLIAIAAIVFWDGFHAKPPGKR